ncbi:MAG: LysM peptidoglycan-binding domain-containing protein [Kiritimatiellia bacterium]
MLDCWFKLPHDSPGFPSHRVACRFGLLTGAGTPFSQYDLIPIQVRPGDTLHGLALMNDTDVETIRELNQITGNLIRPGQVLFVPRPAPAGDRSRPGPADRGQPGPGRRKRSLEIPGGPPQRHPDRERRDFRAVPQQHPPHGERSGLSLCDRQRIPKSEDSQLEVGQRWIKQLQGGHVHSDELNKIAIGICLVGNFESQQPTEKQVKTANALIDYLMQTVIPNPCEFTPQGNQPHFTLCPGRFFPLEQMHERFG